MTYITKANSVSILRKIDFKKAKELKGEVYKKPIYNFSSYEEKILLGLQKLFKNPEEFVDEYYVPIVREDKQIYVFEGGKPAYHIKQDCERLNSKYVNFEIPEQIKDRARNEGGEEKVKQVVIEFRSWFKQKMHLILEERTKEFVEQLEIYWRVTINPQAIEKQNSGYEIKDNLDLNQLEAKIDDIIRLAGKFYNDNPDKQLIIRRFAKYAKYFSLPHIEIRNDTNLPTEELKAFLNKYDADFKVPLKDLLIEYYRVLYNPELKFEGKLLERLGFQSCGLCYKNS